MGLPVVACALVAAVLGTQVANGGGDFVPARSGDPCAPRAVAAVSPGLDGLGESLVLLGLDGAACRLAISREALVLRLGVGGERTRDEVDAVRAGLNDAVGRLEREDRLPKASALLPELLDRVELNGALEFTLRKLPDSLVDNRLPTASVLRTAIARLDVRALLADLADPEQLQRRIADALQQAAIAEALRGLPTSF
ncbi:MAG: hypothetical protein ACT4QG_10275 [Sporichthyaceae bacterium]